MQSVIIGSQMQRELKAQVMLVGSSTLARQINIHKNTSSKTKR